MRDRVGARSAGFVGVTLVLAVAGCASTEITRFPSAQELGEIGAQPPGARVAPDDVADVERWRLAGPLPDAVLNAPHAPATPWEGLLTNIIARRAGLVLASESATCVARETGLFYLDTHGRPSDSLRQFIEGRCGIATSGVTTGYRWGEIAETIADTQLFAQWQSDVEGDISKALAGAAGAELAGVWYGRKNGRAIVIWAVGRRLVQAERIPMIAPGGHVVIRGDLLMPAAQLSGLVTAGRFGVHRCVADPALALPRFALTCDVDAGDLSARLEIAAFPPGRVLARWCCRCWSGPRALPATRSPVPTRSSAPLRPARHPSAIWRARW